MIMINNVYNCSYFFFLFYRCIVHAIRLSFNSNLVPELRFSSIYCHQITRNKHSQIPTNVSAIINTIRHSYHHFQFIVIVMYLRKICGFSGRNQDAHSFSIDQKQLFSFFWYWYVFCFQCRLPYWLKNSKRTILLYLFIDKHAYEAISKREIKNIKTIILSISLLIGYQWYQSLGNIFHLVS